jgi:hypothetical protein
MESANKDKSGFAAAKATTPSNRKTDAVPDERRRLENRTTFEIVGWPRGQTVGPARSTLDPTDVRQGSQTPAAVFQC